MGIGSFVAAIGLAPLVGSEFVPQTDQGFTQLKLTLPVGSSLTRTDEKVRQVETIVLALEGRYETFTVGRNIEWAKVKEIYRLGLKHGMRLATISGQRGVFTDDDIARVRELALAAREQQAAREEGAS